MSAKSVSTRDALDGLPTGAVTLLLTDIEGSTRLWEAGELGMAASMRIHDRTVEDAVRRCGGVRPRDQGEGDSVFVAFRNPEEAVACALEIQLGLAKASWGEGHHLKLRIGIHTGEAGIRDEANYFGQAVVRCARLRSIAHGGQTLLSQSSADLVSASLPTGARLIDLGVHRLRDLSTPEQVFQLGHPELPDEFPPLRSPKIPAGGRLPLFGRESELRKLETLIETSAAGGTQIVVLTGEAGIGKTSLAEEARGRALGHGMQVFSGRCRELERDRPFAPFIEALGSVGELPSDLQSNLVALYRTGEPADPVGAAALRYRIVDDLLAYIEKASLQGSILLLLEDLHWADLSSIITLSRLVTGGEILAGTLLLTLRPEPRSHELDSFLEEARLNRAVEFKIASLDATAAKQVGESTLGARLGPNVSKMLKGAAGNPLFLVELCRALAEEGLLQEEGGFVDTEMPESSPTLRTTILRRISFLRRGTLETLKLCSIWGSSFSLDDLTLTADRSMLDLMADLEPAMRADIVEGEGESLRFRHDLIHDAIYFDITEPIRRALHRQIAAALISSEADPLKVAPHLVRGAEKGDLQAVRWLRQAASTGLAYLDGAAWLSLLETARELADDSYEDMGSLLGEIAVALNRTGRASKAETVARLALERTQDSQGKAILLQGLGLSLLNQGRQAEAISYLEAALQQPALDDKSRVVIIQNLATGWFFRGRPIEALNWVEEALIISERLGDSDLLGFSLAERAIVELMLGRRRRGADLAEKGWELTQGTRNMRAVVATNEIYGLIAAEQGRDSLASDRLSESIRVGEEMGFVPWLSRTYLWNGLLLWQRGQWDEALIHLERASQLWRDSPTGLPLPALGLQAVIYFYRDQDPISAKTLAEAHPIAEQSDSLLGREFYELAVALRSEAGNENAQAFERVRESLGLLGSGTILVWLQHVAFDYARIALAAGDMSTAGSLRDEVEKLAVESESDLMRGYASLVSGLVESDENRLRSAAEVFHQFERPFHEAQAREQRAVVLAETAPEGAREDLSRALNLYEELGASREFKRATARLRKQGIRPKRRRSRARATVGWESLTQSELKVAELMSDGLTYREIADQLFISRRTVESHAASILRKLELTSRRELRGVVGRAGH